MSTLQLICLFWAASWLPAAWGILKASDYEHYITQFNAQDNEIHPTWIPNSGAWNFLRGNIPLLDLPDKRLEQIYYFRWWTYRKHIKPVRGHKYSFVITEFLPSVKWAGINNTIPCAAAHHVREGRWLHNTTFVSSYLRFWTVSDGGNPRSYSFWLADSVRAFSLVTGAVGRTLSHDLLPKLVTIFETIQHTNYDHTVGLYYNTDNRDGMELSIGGNQGKRQYRPTLNSYQYGEAVAVAKIATSAGSKDLALRFRKFAAKLRAKVEHLLWDKEAKFFKALSYVPPHKFTSAKELIGYTPWYFHLPTDPLKYSAWLEFSNNTGFSAPHGLTTAVQRDPHFSTSYSWLGKTRGAHECRWDGPIWPYATSITLTALANLLNTPTGMLQLYVNRGDYFRALLRYAYSHSRRLSEPAIEAPVVVVKATPARRRLQGTSAKTAVSSASEAKIQAALKASQVSKRVSVVAQGAGGLVAVPWIDENMHPYSGDWIARTVLRTAGWPEEKGGEERGKDYNHSTFVDLLLSGLFGVRPRAADGLVDINPLVPATANWAYFCVDRILYHGHMLTLLWDATGERYGQGKGFRIYVDGALASSTPTVQRVKIQLKQA